MRNTSRRTFHGARVYRRYCQSPGCPMPVRAVSTYRQKCALPLSVRFELCESHTVLEIYRHADGEWSARISALPEGWHDGIRRATDDSFNR